MSRFESLRRGRRGRRALFAGVLITATAVVLVAPAEAVSPTPTPDHAVTLSASPVTLLANGQAITFTVNTSGGTTLVGNITAHLCIHGAASYGTTTFGYSGQFANRCVYDSGSPGPPGITAGGLSGADYERTYGSYSGTETTSGPLVFHAGTGSVTWGNASGYGPFTLQADSTHEADLVIQINLSGDSVPTTYFIQPLTFASVPGAPTAVKAQPGSGSATVSWTAPANHGVSPITGYTVTPFRGATALAPHVYNTAATSQTITGFTNGLAYTFKVKATNSAGTGAQSAASPAVTVGAPKSPGSATVKTGSTTTSTGTITVTYTTPTNNGAAITKFTATCVSGNAGVTRSGVHTGATAGAIAVTGATTAKTYTCTVTATNARGTSPPSTPSVALVVGSPAQVARPTVVKTVAGTLKSTFTNLTAAQANGSPLTTPKYTATCVSSDGGPTKSAAGTASPISVTGLTPGKTYTCNVKAHNARGYGLASAASLAHTA